MVIQRVGPAIGRNAYFKIETPPQFRPENHLDIDFGVKDQEKQPSRTKQFVRRSLLITLILAMLSGCASTKIVQENEKLRNLFHSLQKRIESLEQTTISLKVINSVKAGNVTLRPLNKNGRHGTGYGFLISPTEIWTAYHVVENMADTTREIDIFPYQGKLFNLSEEPPFKANIVKFNPDNDWAILKLNKPLEKAPFPPLNPQFKLGEPIFIIGSPFNFTDNITVGRISHTQRKLITPLESFEPLIGVDVAINPGNSGGPLYNSKGEVIGIIFAKINGGEGLGFAIPIQSVLNDLENGSFEAVSENSDSVAKNLKPKSQKHKIATYQSPHFTDQKLGKKRRNKSKSIS